MLAYAMLTYPGDLILTRKAWNRARFPERRRNPALRNTLMGKTIISITCGGRDNGSP
jgi:hypothetical protein